MFLLARVADSGRQWPTGPVCCCARYCPCRSVGERPRRLTVGVLCCEGAGVGTPRGVPESWNLRRRDVGSEFRRGGRRGVGRSSAEGVRRWATAVGVFFNGTPTPDQPVGFPPTAWASWNWSAAAGRGRGISGGRCDLLRQYHPGVRPSVPCYVPVNRRSRPANFVGNGPHG